MAQFARPNSDVTTANWAVTGAATHWAALDEVTPSDADFSQIGPAPTALGSSPLVVGLSAVTDPMSGSGHIVRWRASKFNEEDASGRVLLQQGTTTIATFATRALGAATTFTETLTAAQADAITDYSQLRLRFETVRTVDLLKTDAGVSIFWAELEVPVAARMIAVGQSSGLDAAQIVERMKLRALGQATETSAAQPVARAKIRPVGQAVATDQAQAVGKAKTRTVGQAVETDAAQVVTVRTGRVIAVGQAAETGVAQPLTRRKTQTVGQAAAADAAGLVTVRKVRAVGQAAEGDAARAVLVLKSLTVGQALEAAAAQAARVLKQRAVGQAAEIDAAQAITLAAAGTTDRGVDGAVTAGGPQGGLADRPGAIVAVTARKTSGSVTSV